MWANFWVETRIYLPVCLMLTLVKFVSCVTAVFPEWWSTWAVYITGYSFFGLGTVLKNEDRLEHNGVRVYGLLNTACTGISLIALKEPLLERGVLFISRSWNGSICLPSHPSLIDLCFYHLASSHAHVCNANLHTHTPPCFVYDIASGIPCLSLRGWEPYV